MSDITANFLSECGNKFEFPTDENNILTIKRYVTIGIGTYAAGDLGLWGFNMEGKDYVNLGIAEVKIDMSTLKTNIDIRGEMLSGLERELKDELADHEVKINHLKSQISKLTAIEYHGGCDDR